MTNDYRYRLDNSRPRIKVSCPACGRPRKLVRYVDTHTGMFLADHVGKCDRIFKCGYHYTPSDYFRDYPWLNNVTSYRPMSLRINERTSKPSFIERSRMVESMNRCQTSALFRFLSSLWGEEETMRLFRLYNVGTTTRMNDAAVFWQVDIKGRIRTGKIMRYGNDGHRIKEDESVNFMWVHRMKSMVDNPEDFNLVQCFFGEHLLSAYPDSKVMIVESEKSAVIASHYYPQYLWLASGGCCGCLNQTASHEFKNTSYNLSQNLLDKYDSGAITLYELINELFEPWEQVDESQHGLLAVALQTAADGIPTPHVGTGAGGSSSDLPWNDNDKNKFQKTKFKGRR